MEKETKSDEEKRKEWIERDKKKHKKEKKELIEKKAIKLKTLKDLRIVESTHPIIFESKLKKEAIKWIQSEMPKEKKDIRDREIVNVFIIHFFNITEEDLK